MVAWVVAWVMCGSRRAVASKHAHGERTKNRNHGGNAVEFEVLGRVPCRVPDNNSVESDLVREQLGESERVRARVRVRARQSQVRAGQSKQSASERVEVSVRQCNAAHLLLLQVLVVALSPPAHWAPHP